MLVPVYALLIKIIIDKVLASRGSLWAIIYSLAAAITLIPAHLFEFRYFTPGAVILYLNIAQVIETA
jgi:hypothetical protein